MSTQELLSTSPTTVAEALTKLPQFFGSSGNTTFTNPSSNSVGNFLSLRNLGPIRTLILEDGHRVNASAIDGTVDTNTLPELLLARVDVVTGGASAVYGSDAVAGVVNYIIDRKFNGLKGVVQGGISDYGDDKSVKAGIAGGTSVLDGKLHLEGSFQYYNSDGVPNKFSRGFGRAAYCLNGLGTVASPHVVQSNCTSPLTSYDGIIHPVGTPAFISNIQAGPNGTIIPFVHGTPTVSPIAEIGGDGGINNPSTLVASLRTKQAFARADYDVGGSVRAYVQGQWTQTDNFNTFAPFGPTEDLTYSSSNPYLNAASQATVRAMSGSTFLMDKSFLESPLGVKAHTTAWQVTAGLSAKLGRFTADLYYTHGKTVLDETAVNNIDTQKLFAGLDAVVNPTNGQIVCNVTLTNPGLYPGCTPINPFGPNTPGSNPLAYAHVDTSYTLTNTLDDVGGTLAGSAFRLPAGSVEVALTGEFRRVGLSNVSNYRPSQLDDCTGLRFNCTTTTQLYFLNTTEPLDVSETITEGAFETTVPILKDSRFGKDLSVNGAVRYAHYSASGNATTWKVGVDWQITNDFRLRGTRSRDIRAPTLNDLYSPATQITTALSDTLTGQGGFAPLTSRGNPALKPEIAQTLTVGAVYRPHYLPGFSLAVDYYHIRIDNAIAAVSGGNTLYDSLCTQSGGTSPFCSLYARPFPVSNSTPANFPTALFATSLNVAQDKTHGIDIESDYQTKVGPGRLVLRAFANYQPSSEQTAFAGQPSVNAAGTIAGNPKWRVTVDSTLSLGRVNFNLQERWRSALAPTDTPGDVYVPGSNVPPAAYTDIRLSYRPKIAGVPVTGFLSIQNLLNKNPPIYAGVPAIIANFGNPVVAGDDVIGRYFTLGLQIGF